MKTPGKTRGGKWRAMWVSILTLLAGILLLTVTSCTSGPPQIDRSSGRLHRCPKAPACLCSEYDGGKSAVEPLAFTGEPELAWAMVRTAVEEIGGNIEECDDRYLWATFRSRVIGFVDDLELRLVANQQIIHVRSASRVGYSDLGVNRKRLDRLRARFDQLIDE